MDPQTFLLTIIIGFIAHKVLYYAAPISVKFSIGGGKTIHLHHWLWMGAICFLLTVTYVIMCAQDSDSSSPSYCEAKVNILYILAFLIGYCLAGMGPGWEKFVKSDIEVRKEEEINNKRKLHWSLK